MKNFWSSDLALKIISVVIAIGLWLYVVQVQSPDAEATISDIPVVFTQRAVLEEKGLSLIMDKAHTVDIRVRGKRKTIVDINNTNVTVTADVSQIDSTGTHTLYTSVVLPIGGVEILKKTPATLTVEVDELMTKELAVEPVLTGSPAQNYVAGPVTVEPQTVTVTGPKTVVEGITSLTASLDITGKDADALGTASIQMVGSHQKEINSPYVSLSATEANITCQILKTREVSLYPVFSAEMLAGETIYEADTGSVKTVRVAGAADVVDALEYVKTEPITALEDNQASARLILPTGVRALDGDVVSLRFVQKPKSTKQLTVTQISGKGISADSEFTLPPDPVTVTLVGSETALAQITSLTGWVDMTGLEPGSYSLPLELSYLGSAWTDQTYYVDVQISHK